MVIVVLMDEMAFELVLVLVDDIRELVLVEYVVELVVGFGVAESVCRGMLVGLVDMIVVSRSVGS